MNKAIFLDRDGVINVDTEYTHKIDDLQFIPRTIDALKILAKTEYKIIIVTGQSGIGRGYYKEEDFHKFMEYMLSEFKKEKIRIEGIYFCPHISKDNCACRKPLPGMLENAKRDFNIDFKKSFVVGDKTADVKMGENVGCKTILVKTGKSGQDKHFEIKPDFVAEDLYEGVKWILNQK